MLPLDSSSRYLIRRILGWVERCFLDDLKVVWLPNFLCRELPLPTFDPMFVPSHSSPHPLRHPHCHPLPPIQALLTEIDWSAYWIVDQWIFSKLLPCRTESFDRSSQPVSLSHQQMLLCHLWSNCNFPQKCNNKFKYILILKKLLFNR